MARIEDLIDEIADPDLREQIGREVKELKSTKRFGLVYEDHVPETVSLFGLPVRPGSIVQKRVDPEDQMRYTVVELDGERATIAPIGTEDPVDELPVRDLLTVKRFEEPVYPGLTPVGEVRRGPHDKPAHTVISGENYHALQLLAYTHAGKVDVIYLDPPYNTGDKSWKYNNRFVDSNDSYRHSKWLAMMAKRLRLAETLLKPDGVLVVTIDEHEVHHLGVLLEGAFPDTRRQMVTAVVNSAGVQQGGFSRVEEYITFCFFGNAQASLGHDDLLSDEKATRRRRDRVWDYMHRTGTNAKASDRPNMAYPLAVDPDRLVVVGAGRSLLERSEAGELSRDDFDQWRPDPLELVGGLPVLWPIRSDGTLGNWQVGRETLAELIDGGFIRVSRFDRSEARGSVMYVSKGYREKLAAGEIEAVDRADDGSLVLEQIAPALRAKTVWNRPAHNAGTHGSGLLKALLGDKRFDFPKSVYSTLDTLATLIRNAPNALVLDFFAGSGTTLHSVAMLNAQDGGSRRCILVTNNDVSDSEVKALNEAGHFVGDPEYEAQGIFEAVAKRRVEAAITGVRADGEPVDGSYLDQYLPGHDYADGFEENAAFFRMDYLEPDLVELGRQYEAVAPLLWIAAGSIGHWETWDGESAWSAPGDSSYAVLFDESEAASFGAYVESRSEEISHAWIVTNSHSAYLDLQEQLPAGVEVGQLYRDYLRNFVVNVPRAIK